MRKFENRGNAIFAIVVVIFLLAACAIAGIFYFKTLSKKPSAEQAGQPALPTVAPAEAERLSNKKNLPLEIVVPEGAGHIVEGFTADGDSKKVVIHIQDIHTNYEAQKNLSKMLEALVRDKDLKLIMVEGGWGNVNLSYLRTYATRERRIEVAEEYLKAGKISGEEYLDIVSDYDIVLEGVEEEALYKQNLDAFFEIEKFRQKGADELERLKSSIRALKKKIYPKQLLELEKAEQDYEEEEVSLADYYKQIDKYAKKTRQDLANSPNFRDFMRVIETEKEIKFPAVEKERTKLIERISKKLPKQKLTALVTKSLEFRLNKLTPGEYHTYLIKVATEAGEEMEEYPNLEKYVLYIKSHEDVDTARLFDEAEKILKKTKEGLTANVHQKRLNEISTAVKVLDNFLHLKLVPNDFDYYKEHKNTFLTTGWIDFLNQQMEKAKVRKARAVPANTIDKNLATLVRFYDIANRRDEVFVKNAISLMDEKGLDLAVLIAGGFHTPPLTQKFRDKNLSYIVVAPHTSQPTDPELYRYILKYKAGAEE